MGLAAYLAWYVERQPDAWTCASHDLCDDWGHSQCDVSRVRLQALDGGVASYPYSVVFVDIYAYLVDTWL